MTLRQQQLYNFVTAYIAVHGQSPTLMEMAQGVGEKHKTSIIQRVTSMVGHGYLTKDAGKWRSIRPVVS